MKNKYIITYLYHIILQYIMFLSSEFTSRFSKKGIFLRDFETYIIQQSEFTLNSSFLIDYTISEKFAKMFTRQELTTMMNQIFTDLQFVKISFQNVPQPQPQPQPQHQPQPQPLPLADIEINLIEKLKEFQYCFYKVETTSDFKKADVICNDIDNWIGIKAKFMKYSV